MSNYWSGKGYGDKIAIKFDKPLLGDVTGNENAFTVTGYQRNPLRIGELQLKEYTVDSVERYPVATLFEDDFEGGDVDGVELGPNGLRLEQEEAGYTADLIPTMTSNTAPSGAASASTEFSAVFAAWAAMDDNNSTYWSNTSGSLPAWLQYEFVEGRKIQKYSVRARSDATDGAPRTWQFQAWDGSQWVVLDSRSNITGWANGERREYTFSNSVTYARYRLHITENNGRATTNISEIEMMEAEQEYAESGTYTPPPIDTETLPPDPRIRFDTDTPEGTSITVEYAASASDTTPPETWTEVNDGDLLTVDGDFLWLRYTLETEDTAVTPTLLSLWIEEAEAPPDTIVLHFDTLNRFNDAEGNITVAYTQALGTLAGVRPVEDFSESFEPEDLEPTPVDEHIITVRGEPVVDFINVTYEPGYEAHTVTVTGTGVFVDFIHVDDIPP